MEIHQDEGVLVVLGGRQVYLVGEGRHAYDGKGGLCETLEPCLIGSSGTYPYSALPREPCFVVWPGIVKAGARSEAMIQSIATCVSGIGNA